MAKSESAADIQIGGNHYKDMPIQPAIFAFVNKLNVFQFSAIKYMCRYKLKGGREDLQKAKHMIDMLIEQEYPDERDPD